jgi:hypothetical protein
MFRSGFFALAITIVGAIIVLYHVLSGGGLGLSIGLLIGVLCMADGVLRLLLMQRGER